MSHEELARLWAKWNGQRGTEQQIARIVRTLGPATLTRMLKARGVL